METAATSSIILPQYRELVLCAARKYDLVIIEATGDQRLHRLQDHGVDLERYGGEQIRIKKMQAEIEARPENISLAWTLR